VAVDPALFASIVENSLVSITVWELVDPADDLSLTLVFANPRASKIFSIDLQAGIGRRMTDVFPMVPPARVKVYADVVRTREPAQLVSHLHDGVMSIKAIAIGSAVCVMAEDVTKEHEALAENKRLGGFLDSILESLPLMVFVKEAAELRFRRLNRAGEELLGLDRAELMGKNDFDFFPKEQAEFFVNADRKTLAAGAVVDIPEEPIRTKRGQRWLHTKKVPIIGPHGRATHLLGISEDITERRLADEALRVANAATQAANRELEAFSYSVAHDLRAPLRSIDGFSQALLEDHAPKLDPEATDYINRIRRATKRTAQIIDDLLQLSRVTRREVNFGDVDLGEIAREILADLRMANPSRDVCATIQDGLVVRGDRGLLRIALANLLGNAMKFTARREQANIEVGAATKNGERAFYVKDDGVGFDMKYGNKLFAAFERLHSVDDFEGSGIGLAIVARVVARHGGKVWGEGEIDKGATFWLVLPT
jgi:PAS domain S-box-containing protein